MPRLDPQSLPQHLDRLYRAAWALCGSPHEAEDLVQETFARVLARPRVLRGQDELAYLMQVLRNTFLTQRRTAARRPRTGATTLDDVEAVDARTARRPEDALEVRELLDTIGALAENHRLALVAVDVLGLSYREAADALGTREATIATRVFRAREQVANELGRGRRAPESAPAQDAPRQNPIRPDASRRDADPRGAPAGDAPPAHPPPGHSPALAPRAHGKVARAGGVFSSEVSHER